MSVNKLYIIKSYGGRGSPSGQGSSKTMRYLVLADVHANAAALDAVLEDADWDELLFLGDTINYGPQPVEAIERLADLPGTFLEGNHDRKIRNLSPDASVHSQPETWARWTRRQLSGDHLDYLDQLEGPTQIEQAGRTFQLHHGDFSSDDVWDFDGRLWPDGNRAVFVELAERYPASSLLHAHTHIQFELDRAGIVFANPGSVGQSRLGTPEACYAILEQGELNYHATEYDIEQTCEAMNELPLDPEYVSGWKDAYRTGILPKTADLRDFTPLRELGYR